MTNNHTGLTIALGILSVLFLVTTLYTLNNPTTVEKEIPAPERAMVLYFFDSWGANIDNAQEVIFSGYLYNFGLIEAKNVTVKCTVSNNDREVYTSSYSAGNVGSASYKYLDIIKKFKVSPGDVGVCVVESCDDNCLNLTDRVPEE